MKHLWKFALAALVMAGFAALASLTQLNRVQADDPLMPNNGSIYVSGDAEVRVTPDEVVLTFGVESTNADLAAAKADNDTRTAAVMALAEKYGLQPDQARQDFINVEPRYDDATARLLVNYVVSRTIVFTLKDVSKFEDLLSDAIAAGANYVYSVDFRTTELRKYRDQAREMAIKAAREKADALAKAVGQSIGAAININEVSNNWWGWYGYRGSMGANAVSQNVAGAPSGGASGSISGFAPGQITVSASVNVTFQLNR
jgi:uncharacterized protein